MILYDTMCTVVVVVYVRMGWDQLMDLLVSFARKLPRFVCCINPTLLALSHYMI